MSVKTERQFARNFGFPCVYTPTIQDGPVFRWYLGNDEVLSASREGVCINCPFVMKENGVRDLLKLANLALQVHDKLDSMGQWDSIDAVRGFIKDHKGE